MKGGPLCGPPFFMCTLFGGAFGWDSFVNLFDF